MNNTGFPGIRAPYEALLFQTPKMDYLADGCTEAVIFQPMI